MKIIRRILLILVCLILAGYLAYKIAYPYVAPMVFDYIVDHNIDAFVKLEESLSDSLTGEELWEETPTDSADGTSEFEEPSEFEPTEEVPGDLIPSEKENEGQQSPMQENPLPGVSEPDSEVQPSQKPETTKPVKPTPGKAESAPTPKPEKGDGKPTPKPTNPPKDEKPNTDIQSVKTTMGVFSGAQLARALKNMSPKDKTRIISLCQSAVSTADILKVSKMMMQDGLTKDQQKYIENYLRDNLSVPSKREILEILQKY